MLWWGRNLRTSSLLLLNKLSKILDKESVRLYRDNGVGVSGNLSGPQTEHKRKTTGKVFKDCGLRITIQANLRKVNFLDVQLNRDTSTYQPCRKPDNNPVYLSKNFSHPTTVLKQSYIIEYMIYNRMKIFSHNRYLYIKMLDKGVVLQNNSNTLQAIIAERTIQKRRNGTKEKSSGSVCHIQWM